MTLIYNGCTITINLIFTLGIESVLSLFGGHVNHT